MSGLGRTYQPPPYSTSTSGSNQSVSSSNYQQHQQYTAGRQSGYPTQTQSGQNQSAILQQTQNVPPGSTQQQNLSASHQQQQPNGLSQQNLGGSGGSNQRFPVSGAPMAQNTTGGANSSSTSTAPPGSGQPTVPIASQAQVEALPILGNLENLLKTLSDPQRRDDLKLKALQEISDNFECLASTNSYAPLIDNLLRIFLKLLGETVPQFIGENNTQQLRKLILEMTLRMPFNDYVKSYAKHLNSLLFKLIQSENEENVLIAVKIIIEIQKAYRPAFTIEIQQFLAFCKSLYRDLSLHLPTIFEPRRPIHVKDIKDLNIECALQVAFSVTPIMTEQKLQDGNNVVYTLLPRGSQSLKVLAELPIVVVLLYQIHRSNVQQDIADFIPLVLTTISLSGPDQQTKSNQHFSRELHIDFIGAQVKALSFLAFLVRIFTDLVSMHSANLVKGIMDLLESCPSEVSHLRRELLVATRHLMGSELRNKFVAYLPQFFNEQMMVGPGHTCNESLRPLVFSALADLVHHVRAQLPLGTLSGAVHLFSRCLHDHTLPGYVQAMCGKLMLNLVECIVKNNEPSIQVRDLLFYMLEVFIRKFKVIANYHVPAILAKYAQPGTAGPSSNGSSGATAGTTDQTKMEIDPSSDGGNKEQETEETEVKKEAEEEKTEDGEKKEGTPGEDEKTGSQEKEETTTAAPDTKTQKGSGGSGGIESTFWQPMTVSDCRALIRVLVCGAKTTAWGIEQNGRLLDPSYPGPKPLRGKETRQFIRLLRYGMKSLDVYLLVAANGSYQKSPANSSVRAKDEKETLDHFASVYTTLNLHNFKEIFSTHIEFVVDRISGNYALQLIPNSFLVNVNTSSAFGSILVQSLLKKMQGLGSNSDAANLYLKLFKLVFGSVSYFPGENELMLKPHLHFLVNKSMELALSAKEPINYFLLLRGLFRSIGGGSHDMLYQEFLPLLPSLLKGLNCLQSGAHRQSMRELFVELCLTVPVRLSSLLPYLPLLMDPLVSALNGSPQLVQQGLRTLELCVDNLQPEFLYEHMAPVRAQLMQALWRCVSSHDEQTPVVALRILGKFGGSNRKMLTDPQKLTYLSEAENGGPKFLLSYLETESTCPIPGDSPSGGVSVDLSVGEIVKVAMEFLRVQNSNAFHRQESWKLVKTVILSAFRPSSELNLDRWQDAMLRKLNYRTNELLEVAQHMQQVYIASDRLSREVTKNTLKAMFYAVWSKDLRAEVLPLFNAVMRNLAIQLVLEQTGPDFLKSHEYYKMTHMDSSVLAEAIAGSLADPGKEFCHPAVLAMTLIMDTISCLMGSKERACQLPFVGYLFQQVWELCYDPAWYARLGGCAGLKFMLHNFPATWAQKNASKFYTSFFAVIVGLHGEISSGAIDMAKSGIDILLGVVCNSDLQNEDKREAMVVELLRESLPFIFSVNSCLHTQCLVVLESLAKYRKKSVSSLLSLVEESIKERINSLQADFTESSIDAQIGFLEGFAFCYSLDPSFLRFDLGNATQKEFIDELVSLSESDQAQLSQRPCYERETLLAEQKVNYVQLKCSILRALGSAYMAIQMGDGSVARREDVKKYQEKVFLTIFKALTHGGTKLQQTAFECLKKAMDRQTMDMQTVTGAMRPVLLNLSDYKNVSLNVANRLLYLTKLSPNAFNEKLCDQLLLHLKKWLELAENNGHLCHQQPGSKPGLLPFLSNEMETCAVILDIIHLIPAASGRFIDQLIPLISKAEVQLSIEPGSSWRAPLLKFLVRYPIETIRYFLKEENLRETSNASLFLWMVKHEDGKVFRDVLMSDKNLLSNLLVGQTLNSEEQYIVPQSFSKAFTELMALKVIAILSKRNPDWLSGNRELVDLLRALWKGADFRNRYIYSPSEYVEESKFEAPNKLVKILLRFYRSHPECVELLFDIVMCFVGKWLADFSFVRQFLEGEVVTTYSIEWRRNTFRRFLEIYVADDRLENADLLSKVLQHVIQPCFAYTFERGDIEQLIGPSAPPEQGDDDNLVCLFVAKVVDQFWNERSNYPDPLHIHLYQLSCLFVEYAATHIHDPSSRRQGIRLRKFMLFAWPCLQTNTAQDPTVKYHGHLLIAHIIDKFAINRKIVLQVFSSLLKAHGQDPRGVIRQALNILTPAVPLRMEDGNFQLCFTAKKIITEESHQPAQLLHLLQLIIRHYKVYYPMRHELTGFLLTAIQKLVSQSGNIDNRKLSVEVCEMIIKWELYRLKQSQENEQFQGVIDAECQALLRSPSTPSHKHPTETPIEKTDSTQEKTDGEPMEEDTKRKSDRTTDKSHLDQVMNFLLRIACQVPDQVSGTTTYSSGNTSQAQVEALNKRALQLLKVALKPTLWGSVATLKLLWMDKTLQQPESPQHNAAASICLDVVSFLITIVAQDQVVPIVLQLQRGIAASLNCSSSNVVRSLYNFLSRLLNIIKMTDYGMEKLEMLSKFIQKFITDTLSNYEKMTGSNIASLYGAMTVLKAMCTAQPKFLDYCLPQFTKTLQKLAKEHVTPVAMDAGKSAADMISLCLDLLRPKLELLQNETRKMVVSTILSPLIEKSSSSRVVLTIAKMLDEWIKALEIKESGSAIAPGQYRQVLLVKLMYVIDARFGGKDAADEQLRRQFLETVLYVYSTGCFRTSEIVGKLEPAFHRGLCHADPELRREFFKVWDKSVSKNPYDRLWYIMCTQNWEPMKEFYWIKYCLQLMLSCVDTSASLCFEGFPSFGNSRMSLVRTQSEKLLEERIVEEQMSKMDVNLENLADVKNIKPESGERKNQLESIVEKQRKLLEDANALTISEMVEPLCSLCFADNELTEKLWLKLMPVLWGKFTQRQRDNLKHQVVPFLLSGNHLLQKDLQISPIKTFVEGFARCEPVVEVKPDVLKYLGVSYKLWHRVILMLEERAMNIQPLLGKTQLFFSPETDTMPEKLETLDALADLYKSLNEMDMWEAVWNRRACHPETLRSLAFSQQGFFVHALDTLEHLMAGQQAYLTSGETKGLTLAALPEVRLWEEEWIRCTKELNDWDVIKDFTVSNAVSNPFEITDCAWRLPDWNLMRDALAQVEGCCPGEYVWLAHLYKGYLSVCHPEEQNLQAVDKFVEAAGKELKHAWRRLPKIIGLCHIPILQATQRVMELQEACQLTTSLAAISNRQNNLHDMKAVVKTWRNRTSTVSDSLNHWYDIFSWRLHHYLKMISTFEACEPQQQSALLPMHSCAQCLVLLSKKARRDGQMNVALNVLNKLHSMPNLPVMDGFLKLYEQIKCCIRLGEPGPKPGPMEFQECQDSLLEGLDLIENTNITYFSKEQSARMYALKGAILSRLDKAEEAEKAFSASLQMHDSLNRAWSLWGEHLEAVFFKTKGAVELDKVSYAGNQALICFLQAARHEQELKSRKHLAKSIWLMKCTRTASMKSGGNVEKQLNQVLEKYGPLVGALSWVPWIPQLLGHLKETNASSVVNLLSHVGEAFPQALFYQALTALGKKRDGVQLEIETRAIESRSMEPHEEDMDEVFRIKPKSWDDQLIQIVRKIRRKNPVEIRAMFKIVEELISMSENWSESGLRKMRECLKDCYQVAFENRSVDMHTVSIPDHCRLQTEELLMIITPPCLTSGATESRDFKMRRKLAEAMTLDMKGCTDLGRLHNLIDVLSKWLGTVQAYVNQLPEHELLSNYSQYLSLYLPQIASVLVPGEMTLPKASQYCVRIARFLPKVEFIRNSDSIGKKISLRGHNGKIYSFVLETVVSMDSFEKEMRTNQLGPMLNGFFGRDKETSRRLLQYSFRRVIPLLPPFRLIEVEDSTRTFSDILRTICSKKGFTPNELMKKYYERLGSSRGGSPSHQLLRDIFKDLVGLLGKDSLKNWIAQRFPDATDYYTLRKQTCLHLSVFNVLEHVLHFTRLNPGDLSIQLDSGFAYATGYKWDILDTGELNGNQAVSFRLTPSLAEFLKWTIQGHMEPSMIAVTRCLQSQHFAYLLRPFLWDEYAQRHKLTQGEASGDNDLKVCEKRIALVNKAVSIITAKLQGMTAGLEMPENNVGRQINVAQSIDNLCRMDPSWHPWF